MQPTIRFSLTEGINLGSSFVPARYSIGNMPYGSYSKQGRIRLKSDRQEVRYPEQVPQVFSNILLYFPTLKLLADQPPASDL